MTLELADLDALKDISIKEFDARVSRLSQGACDLVNGEMMRLQAELEQIYRVVVLLQKHEPSMERAAEIWEKMVGICDAFGKRALDLAKRYPDCKASHDRILDLRNAAEERRRLHARP